MIWKGCSETLPVLIPVAKTPLSRPSAVSATPKSDFIPGVLTGSGIDMAMKDYLVGTTNHTFSTHGFSLFRELRTVTGDPYSAHNCSGPRTQTEITLSIATEAVPSGLARGGAKTLD